jgi:hypothetical protein
MGTCTKIMVILTFLTSLVVAVVSLKMADRIVKQDAIITSLATSGAAQKEMASSWDTILTAAKGKVTGLQSETEGVRGELEAAQANFESSERNLADAQTTQEAADQEITALKDKNTALTASVVAEKANVAKAIAAGGSTGKAPIGRVMAATPESGITTYFSGTATVRDGDSLNVYREKKKIGHVVVGKVKRTIVICSEGVGSTATPIKGDLVRK